MALSVLPPPPDVEVPRCSHGPALLFSRSSARGTARLFYACAACRRRRACPLNVPADAEGRPLVIHKHSRLFKTAGQPRKALLRRSRHLARCRDKDVAFCRSCCVLVVSNQHDAGHELLTCPRRLRRQPTRLLAPRTANSTNAQFLFDASALALLLSAAKRAGASTLLCLGCPRLHEAALRVRQRRGAAWPDSVLLDLDERFSAFFGARRFARYNLFNQHAFGPRRALRRLKGQRILMVCDPPYGGLLQALGHSLQQLREEMGAGSVVGTVLVMPYFMEKKVSSFLPELKICDFPISYENHRKFAAASPARLFSDLSPSVLRPWKRSAHLFRFCRPCGRFSALENRHCDRCRSCPTRHGTTYRHCSPCGRCVKPTWKHCARCGFCVQPLDHRCSCP